MHIDNTATNTLSYDFEQRLINKGIELNNDPYGLKLDLAWDELLPTGKERDKYLELIAYCEKDIQVRNFKKSIRLSAEDAIIDYIDGLNDDNRRIETCYDIVKICKHIANELQACKKVSA